MTHLAAAITGLAIEPQDGTDGSHVTLRLVANGTAERFDWLPRDPAFEAAVARLAARSAQPWALPAA